MADGKPYDIMPRSEIQNLKKQLAELKKNPNANEQLVSSMNALTKSMDSMLHIFKTAADEIKFEDREDRDINERLRPIEDKLDELLEQNKVIAEGMVAISDMVRERLPEKKEYLYQKTTVEERKPRSMPPPMPQSMPPPPGRMPPPRGMPPPGRMPPPSSPFPPPDNMNHGMRDENPFEDLPPLGEMPPEEMPPPPPPGDFPPPEFDDPFSKKKFPK